MVWASCHSGCLSSCKVLYPCCLTRGCRYWIAQRTTITEWVTTSWNGSFPFLLRPPGQRHSDQLQWRGSLQQHQPWSTTIHPLEIVEYILPATTDLFSSAAARLSGAGHSAKADQCFQQSTDTRGKASASIFRPNSCPQPRETVTCRRHTSRNHTFFHS